MLTALGLVRLAYQGVAHDPTLVNLGPIKATADTQKTIPLPPILGGLALAGGIVVLAGAGRSMTTSH